MKLSRLKQIIKEEIGRIHSSKSQGFTVVPRDGSPSYFVDRNHREYESMMSVIKSNPPTPTTPVEGINDVCGDTGCCKYYFHRRDSFMDWDWYWEACCHTWWLFC